MRRSRSGEGAKETFHIDRQYEPGGTVCSGVYTLSGEWLPQAETLESGKAYRKRILPIITTVVKLIQPLYAKYLDMKRKYDQLQSRNQDLKGRVDNLAEDLKLSQQESNSLRKDLNRVKTVLGDAVIEDAIQTAKQQEQMLEAQKSRNRKHGRDAR